MRRGGGSKIYATYTVRVRIYLCIGQLAYFIIASGLTFEWEIKMKVIQLFTTDNTSIVEQYKHQKLYYQSIYFIYNHLGKLV